MARDRDSVSARQADQRKDTFVILVISTVIAAVLAIGGYFWVFAEDNEELREPLPAVGTDAGEPAGEAGAPASGGADSAQ